MVNQFEDKVIAVWMVMYDSDIDKMYSFNKFEKTIAAVEGSIRSYFGDESSVSENLIVECIDSIKLMKHIHHILIQFGNLKINIYKLEFDNFNPIHLILSRCYNSVNDDHLRSQINDLFSDQNHLD